MTHHPQTPPDTPPRCAYGALKIKEFIQEQAQLSGWTEERTRMAFEEHYGTVEEGLRVWEKMQEEERSWMASKQEGIAQIGRKPRPGEDVVRSRLEPNLSIRVWGGDLAPYHSYSFDFVDNQDNYVLTPPDIKIYSEGVGEVLSIEERFRRQRKNRQFDKSYRIGGLSGTEDKNWETYIVPEGTLLHITQDGRADRILSIPRRHGAATVLTLQ